MPMEENNGIIFIKKTNGFDIEIKADVKNVTTTIRSTTIGKEGAEIKTSRTSSGSSLCSGN